MSGKGIYFVDKIRERDSKIAAVFSSIQAKDDVPMDDMLRALVAVLRWFELTESTESCVDVVRRVQDHFDEVWSDFCDGDLIERYCPSVLGLVKDTSCVAMENDSVLTPENTKKLHAMFLVNFPQALIFNSEKGVRKFMRVAFPLCFLVHANPYLVNDVARAWKFVEVERKTQLETTQLKRDLDEIDLKMKENVSTDEPIDRLHALRILEAKYRKEKKKYAEIAASEMILFEANGVRKRPRGW